MGANLESSAYKEHIFFPTKCPICSCLNQIYSTKVALACGKIYKCKECDGYFLFPRVHINYKNSGWTKFRNRQWKKNVQLVNRFIPRILRFFEKHMNRPLSSVLEIGCSSGFLGAGFVNAGCQYVGIDVDPEAVSFGQSKGIELYNFPIEKIKESPIYGYKYDLVISYSVYEHVNDPLEAFKAIRPFINGLCIIIVPNALGLSARLKTFGLYRDLVNWFWGDDRKMVYSMDGFWHNIGYTKKTLKYLAKQAKLNTLWVRGLTNNDKNFGFVQRCDRPIFLLFEKLCHILGMSNCIYLVASQQLRKK